MKKLSFLSLSICAIILATSPQTATAGLTELSMVELATVSGQAGIPIFDQINDLVEQTDITFNDDNSIDFNLKNGETFLTTETGVDSRTQGGSLGLTDVYLDATLSYESGMGLDTKNINLENGLVSALTTGNYQVTITNPSLHINSFQTRVMLGADSGSHSCMGVIGAQNIRVETRGSVIVEVN